MSATANKEKILTFLHTHPIAVLGTIDEQGMPYGSAIFVYAEDAHTLYFLSKAETAKMKHIAAKPAVSITIVDSTNNSTLQSGGEATIVEDSATVGNVLQHMTKIYAKSADWLPPIAKINAGEQCIVRVTLTHVRLAEFKGKAPGSTHIFKAA